MNKFNKGFAPLVVIIIIVIVALLIGGGVGYYYATKTKSVVQIQQNQNQNTKTQTPASTLTSSMVLNSNGFVKGAKSLQGLPGGEYLTDVVIGNDSDGTQEAVAIDTWCSASCGRGLVAFKLVNGIVVTTKLPGSGVSGAAQNITSVQINNGVISDAETDFDGTRTNHWQLLLVNGVLQANKIN